MSSFKWSIDQRYIKDDLVVCVRVPVVFNDIDEMHFNDDNFKIATPLFKIWEEIHSEWKLYEPDNGERARSGEPAMDGCIHVFKTRMTREARLKSEEEIIELGCQLSIKQINDKSDSACVTFCLDQNKNISVNLHDKYAKFN